MADGLNNSWRFGLLLAALLVWRFFTTGGRAMLAMMGGGPDDMAGGHGSGPGVESITPHVVGPLT